MLPAMPRETRPRIAVAVACAVLLTAFSQYWRRGRSERLYSSRVTQQTDDPFGMSGYRGAALVATFAVLGVVGALALYRLGPAEAATVSWNTQWTTIKFELLVMVACPVFLFMVRSIARLPRPKSATVFVSYPHEQSTTATTVAESLGQRGLRPRMVPFVERPEQHNEVIGEAASSLTTADVLVVVTAAAVLDPHRPVRFYSCWSRCCFLLSSR